MLPCLIVPAIAAAQMPPPAPQHPVTDTYFGRRVVDPYRWLEDVHSPETKAWLDAQAAYARATLDSLPGRTDFASRALHFADAAPFAIGAVREAGGQLFYVKRPRGANQGMLVVKRSQGGERTLINLEALGGPGKHVSLVDYQVSADGTRLAAVLQQGGAEIGTAHFYDVASGRELPDKVTGIYFDSFYLSADGRTFSYTQRETLPPGTPDMNRYRHLTALVHTIGTPAARDQRVAGKGAGPAIAVADFAGPIARPVDGAAWALAVVYPGDDLYDEVWIRPANKAGGWRKLASVADKIADVYAKDDAIYLVSFLGAPNGRVLRLDGAMPDLAHATIVVPEGTDVLTTGTVMGMGVLLPASDALYVRVARMGAGQLLRIPYGETVKPAMVALPQGMQISDATSNPREPGAMLRLGSWTDPGDVYRYDPSSGTAESTSLVGRNDIDLHDLVAEEVMVKAKDGTDVPLSIIYRKGLRRDGQAPTLLTGYGSYGDVESPAYQRGLNAWFERGGIYAVAHVRGGGELGERWHLAGQKARKHNTWEDFLACAHFLVDNRYTSPQRMGAWSQSAGGILIGRSITTEPAVFAAVVDGVPLADAMRFETDGNGPTNVAEFGTVKTPDGAMALYEMSSYHHVEKGVAYPAVLVTAGVNDPRIPAWQGAKMAAMLQASSSGGPVLLRVSQDAGHFADTMAQRVSDFSDIAAFLLWHFGEAAFQPPRSQEPVASK